MAKKDDKPPPAPGEAPDNCRRCPLYANATQAVEGEGPKRAAIMLVGEQPGDEEDRTGRPFVGPAGALLGRAMLAAGLDRAEVFITNAVKHFKWTPAPRGKRRLHKTPAQREIEACEVWLIQEIAKVEPKVIVALGATAYKALTHEAKGFTEARASEATLDRDGVPLVVTWHPSAALRVPSQEAREAMFAELVKALERAKKIARRG
jgi:uracil-DNA glycosylase family protein